jgi:S-formylglutathione hydrolase
MNIISSKKVFKGKVLRVEHQSMSTLSSMTFAIFLPSCSNKKPVPTLYWLSGLTCNDENFCQKSGAFKYAEKLGIAIVCPDTSPRGLALPGEDESYDFGSGAGFYIDATENPWNENYNMYSYITSELPCFIEKNFNVTNIKSISGHSMGGHGAMICALKNPMMYKSISAFSPIANPSRCQWGEKAFKNYLGENRKDWAKYDSTELLSLSINKQPILIDQGSNDEFFHQLQHKRFLDIAQELGYPITYNIRKGYDHNFYFIATFIESHIEYHANILNTI